MNFGQALSETVWFAARYGAAIFAGYTLCQSVTHAGSFKKWFSQLFD